MDEFRRANGANGVMTAAVIIHLAYHVHYCPTCTRFLPWLNDMFTIPNRVWVTDLFTTPVDEYPMPPLVSPPPNPPCLPLQRAKNRMFVAEIQNYEYIEHFSRIIFIFSFYFLDLDVFKFP